MLTGLNYLKGKTDPVARADDEYPDWLWKCIEITIKKEEAADTDGGDEFCAYNPPPLHLAASILPAHLPACGRQASSRWR